ncbi:MAG: hypothetical protein HDR13_11065 [Lachnospiraceae bacterium]|nr:hypothetical protein [Lachnospiraceae bacterium]
MNENKEFKPYIPAEKITPEFTGTSIIMRVILAIVFGAANAYLGLRVGMTVSASIPAAVISMGVIRVILKKNSILESNMVQTIGAEVPAPQATLMKMIVEGIMGGDLPWTLVFIGVFLALGLEILRVPVMPFAIGLYLPIYLNASIMVGGVVRMVMDARKNVDEKTKERQATDGTLYCAGMIAGEGLVGILLALLAVGGISMDLSGSLNLGNIGGVVLMIVMILCLLKFSLWKKSKN